MKFVAGRVFGGENRVLVKGETEIVEGVKGVVGEVLEFNGQRNGLAENDRLGKNNPASQSLDRRTPGRIRARRWLANRTGCVGSAQADGAHNISQQEEHKRNKHEAAHEDS